LQENQEREEKPWRDSQGYLLQPYEISLASL
jgi:hypothetical protein